MFAKLLKYDCRSVFKYWWVAALTSLPVSLFGGLCIQIAKVENTHYALIQGLSILGIVLVVLALLVLPVLTEILIIMRFYKHFFTDEGYLTFTLPVKRSTLIHSKLLTAMLFSLVSGVIVVVDVLLMLAVGIPEDMFDPRTWHSLWEALTDFYNTVGGFGALYTLQILLILLVGMLLSILTVFVCITLANMVTKRHKVLTAIAFYYGLSAVSSVVSQTLTIGGVFGLFIRLDELEQTAMYTATAFILLGVLGIFAAIATGFYLVELYLLDKRLNLD